MNFLKSTGDTIKDWLIELTDEKFQKFSSSLLPNVNNILGVRLPELRKIAKEISKGDWRNFLASAQNQYFEEIMLQGMVIGYVKADIEELLSYTAAFVPKIDNWSLCDSFCIGLKFTKDNRERVWGFLQPYLISENEFAIRFAVVMLVDFYIKEQYIERILIILDGIKHSGYYAQMAVAWALSICYIKFPEKTQAYIENNSLDDFIYNKTLQKITESHCVDNDTKNILRSMKR